jgi:hypothetical protein
LLPCHGEECRAADPAVPRIDRQLTNGAFDSPWSVPRG